MRALPLLPGAALAYSLGRPNILYVVADDLESDYKQDRTEVMPTLRRRLKEGGLAFPSHAAVCPVCGPSRSSFLAGRYPHNTGYVANARKPSVAAWKELQDDTIGAWLRKAGYYTAYLGKYVNGMECDVPRGWSHWGGFTCKKLHGIEFGGT